MGALIRYFVRYNLVGDLVMLAILAAGWVGLGSTRSNFFPVTESKTIQIQVVYPGASPAEIEEGIVAKIEENLQGIAGLDQVKSVCSENAGSITVTVLDAGETDEILQDVKNAVDRIASFPVGMEPPTVFKQEAIGVAITFAVTGVDDLRALKTEARRIEQDLRALDGISQVALSGFPGEEIEVAIRADKLTELNMTLAEVSAAIRAANVETTGGRLKTAREELIVRGRFRGYDAEALEDIVIRSNVDGRVVRLSDVAVVQDRWADNDPSRSWYNGMPSVVVTVNNLTTESILDVTELVRQYIEAYNLQAEEVGTGLKLDIIRDSSVVLNQRIELLVNNGVVGFLLVILLLALFLNIRLAFWVALAIPVSFAGMFIFAGMAGVTINVISLFGMILVIGILVDDGIVIAENIYRHFEMGKDRYTATIEGTLEVLPAVFSAIVTTMVAFASFFFIEGRLGRFLRRHGHRHHADVVVQPGGRGVHFAGPRGPQQGASPGLETQPRGAHHAHAHGLPQVQTLRPRLAVCHGAALDHLLGHRRPVPDHGPRLDWQRVGEDHLLSLHRVGQPHGEPVHGERNPGRRDGQRIGRD